MAQLVFPSEASQNLPGPMGNAGAPAAEQPPPNAGALGSCPF